jgi:hypothetical protein
MDSRPEGDDQELGHVSMADGNDDFPALPSWSDILANEQFGERPEDAASQSTNLAFFD